MVGALLILLPADARADDDVPAPVAPASPAPTEAPAPEAPAPEAPAPEAPADAVVVEAPEPGAVEAPKKRRVGLTGRVHAGFGQRSLYDDSILGGEFCLGIGAYTPSFNLYLDLLGLVGGSEGLPVQQLRLGPSIDFEAFTRVRLGAGVSAGGTAINRSTNGGSLNAFNLGARVFGSVDLWKFGDRGALYLLGQLSVDAAMPFLERKSRGSVPAAVLWGPTVALGVRF